MSQENVEIVRDWVESVFLQEDVAELGDLSFLDAEVLYEDEILPDHAGETYRGHDGFRRAWIRAIEPWESIDGRLEWVRDAGEDVVSCHWAQMRGKGSGIEAEIRYAYVWRFREGKVVHCKSYLDPAQALEAAGLSE
jgi:ketosteroid isomerase-like protein